MENFIKTDIRKRKEEENLKRFNVAIEDDSQLSPEFFNISQLGDEFSLGKNAFVVRGTEKLKIGSPILVEIKDSSDDIIYSETHDYEEGNSRIISVYVYEDTSIGPCEITLMSETTEDREGNEISERWKGKFNVRWTKKLNVNPNKYNVNSVRFQNQPSVSAESLTLNNFDLSYSGSSNRKDIIDASTENIFVSGRLYLNSFASRKSAIRIDPDCGGSSFSFLRGMEKDKFIFRNPESNFDLSETVKENIGLDDETDFTFNIERVLNENTIILSPGKVANSFSQRIILDCNNDFEIDFFRKNPTSVTSLCTTTCFILLQLKDLETISGAVLRSRIYARDFDTDDPYSFVGDFEIDPRELMNDIENTSTRRGKRTGLFLNQSDVDQYLEPLNTYSFLVSDNDDLLNSVNVQREDGSEILENINFNSFDNLYGGANVTGTNDRVINSIGGTNTPGFSFDDDSDAVIGFKTGIFENSGDISIEKNVEYLLSFRYLLNNRDEFSEDSNFGVFLRFKTKDVDGNILEVEERLKSVQIENGKYQYGDIEIKFESIRDSLSGDFSDLQLVIKVENGNWFFSDFSLIPFQKPGFSPGFSTLFFPIDKSTLSDLGDLIEFRVDLFDLDNNRVSVNLETQSGIDISNC